MTKLKMYVIYYDALDYPGVFCVRKWEIYHKKIMANEVLGTALNINDARKLVPPLLFRIDRSENDPKHIIESWI